MVGNHYLHWSWREIELQHLFWLPSIVWPRKMLHKECLKCIFTEQHYASKVFYDAYLLQAFLEPSVHVPVGLPWQTQRRCGHWLGPCQPRQAHPRGSWSICPYVVCGPDTATILFLKQLQQLMQEEEKLFVG